MFPRSSLWPISLVIGCYLVGAALSFLPAIEALEVGFYRQLIDLSPRVELRATLLEAELPRVMQLVLVLTVTTLSIACRLAPRCPASGAGFVIPVIAGLFMLEILLVVLALLWLPAVWPMMFFGLLSLVQLASDRAPRFRQWLAPNSLCKLEVIRRYVEQKDFLTALRIMQHCPFTDEMFELAYELGISLEQQNDLQRARQVYSWLVQFDPGMQDFIERIDTLQQPGLEFDDSLQPDAEAGEDFAHYHLLGATAHGATSVVHEAYDLNTHKRIALKILNQSLGDLVNPDDASCFLREAMTVAQLDHPNIVKIHDADIVDRQVYIAMDFITGYPMTARLRRGKLATPAEALRILAQMLDALVAAHHKGIVHGDIKPANIMYDQTRKRYVLTDFGAAYSELRSRVDGHRTIGTPAYMSPEQHLSKRVDGRSDLFSLAVTVYQLLGGVQPFAGESLQHIRARVLHEEIDGAQLRGSHCLWTILAKAMEKKPYRRFADAEQMLRAVQRCEQKTHGVN
jgi:serine/threonine-protein kinase